MKIDRTIVIRLLVATALAGAALVMFFMSRSAITIIEQSKQTLSPSVANNIDRDVDSVLTRFRIDKSWIRKNSIPVPNSALYRIERRVAVPLNTPTVQMNVALNSMAKRYDGRAIASENLKENSVTIHIELQGFIVQTIILKATPDLKRGGYKDGQKKV